MIRTIKSLAVLGVLASGLAACSSGGDSAAVVVTPPPPAALIEDSQGAGFGTAFRAGANSDPARDPSPGDVIAVNPSAEPVKLR